MTKFEEEFEEEAAKLNLKNIVIGSIIGALGLLVALSWRDTIQRTIDLFMPKGEGFFYSFVSSILITIFAVVASFVLIKFSQRSIRQIMLKHIKTIRKKK